MIREGRCHECEYDYDQCSDCERKEQQQKDFERNNKKCTESNGKVLAKDCKLKASGTKVDTCRACGYIYVYS